MRAHSDFMRHLTTICGHDKPARLKIIDQFDAIKITDGYNAAWSWIENEAEQHANDPLVHLLSVVQDEAAKRIIQGAFERDDQLKLRWLRSRINTDMIQTAAAYCGMNEDSIIASAKTPIARRRLRVKVKQSINVINIAVGATGRDGYAVCTPFELSMRNEQKLNQEIWALETYIWNEESRKIHCMYDVMKAAGKKRVAEILALSKGLQDFGEKLNLAPMFYTLTAPPHMHGNPIKGENSWDGETTPRQAHNWIHGRHRAAFQILRDEGIYPAGIRTVEGHKDETPHWHCVAWVEPKDADRFIEVFRGVAPTWKLKVGCDIRNMLDEPEDPKKKKAKAVSYLFKYILKSIGGLGDDDSIKNELLNTTKIKERDDLLLGIKQQDCWRSKHQIRGFQFFGLPSQKMWRTLRAIPTAPKDERLQEAWLAARSGLGLRFIEAAGGLNVKRKERPIDVQIQEYVRPDDASWEDEKTTGRYAVYENRLNGFIGEQRLQTWQIIDEEMKLEIENEKTKTLTVKENRPRKIQTTDDEDYFFSEGIIVGQPNAPNLVFWEGDWYPF